MTPDERRQALELEFTRLKERQDFLDRTLQGHEDVWLSLKAMIPSGTELVIDKAVTEARQGALAMATIAKTLAQLTGEEAKAPEVDPLQEMADELARKRAQRAQ